MTAAQTFHCPTCGAPLYYDKSSEITMQCPYCRSSVVVPESLRSKGKEEELPIISAVPGAASLLKPHDSDESSNPGGSLQPTVVSIQLAGSTTLASKQATKVVAGTVGAAGCLVVILVVGILLVTAIPVLFGLAQPGGPLAGVWARVNPLAYGRVTLAFGQEGVGQGMFQDPRSIGVDAKGNIYVGEYDGGRVQVFDAQGEFRSLWPGEEDRYLQALAVSRDGIVYMAYSGEVTRYDSASGEVLGKLENQEDWYFDDVSVAPDGGLVVVAQGETIVRFDAGGRRTLVIPAAVSTVSGDSELSSQAVVDGLGNIYVLGAFNRAVFKFAPDGRFLTRIGSPGDEPGQFRAPNAVAVDGLGRVYVADLNQIEIFDSEGRYLDSIQLPQGVAFGLVFNENNELFAATNAPQVLKFEIRKP